MHSCLQTYTYMLTLIPLLLENVVSLKVLTRNKNQQLTGQFQSRHLGTTL